MNLDSVCVVGLGYIGLPLMAFIADSGIKVHGVDVCSDKIKALQNKERASVEQGIEQLLYDDKHQHLLSFDTEPTEAAIYVLCVPTPLIVGQGEDFTADLSYVYAALDSILNYIDEEKLIIIESTSPVGTTEAAQQYIVDKRTDLATKKLNIAYSPERVIPGNIYKELRDNTRIVGGLHSRATDLAAEFYASIIEGEVLKTDAKTAELCKLAENAYRNTNIAFANELSMLAKQHDIDCQQLIQLANKHPRVDILTPGIGVGGHCIAVDPYFLLGKQASEWPLIQASLHTNSKKTQWTINNILGEISKYRGELTQNLTIGCFGLTYKANVDDLRESPAIEIFKAVRAIYDNTVVIEPQLEFSADWPALSLDEALQACDVYVFLVKHDVFLERYEDIVAKKKLILDHCYFLAHEPQPRK